MKDTEPEQLIRLEAYQIWESEGRPDGKDKSHWFKAEATLSRARSDPKALPDVPTQLDEFSSSSKAPQSALTETAPGEAISSEKTGTIRREVSAVQRLRGHVDVANSTRIAGWVQDLNNPAEHVTVVLFDNDVRVADMVASLYRSHLERAGVGNGTFAFNFIFARDHWTGGRHTLRLVSLSGSQPIPDPSSRLKQLEADLARAVP